MSTKVRCLNLDWLEVYATEDCGEEMNAEWFERQGWQVRRRDYGTRTYKEMFTVCDAHGFPFVEVRRSPVGMFRDGTQSFLDPLGCHLRLVNRYCYHARAVEFLQDFMCRCGYSFKRIFKVDLCLDFEKFDSGDFPRKFVKRFVNGKYSKINQSNVALHGRDCWDCRDWNSVSWGSKASPVFTRLYDKTLELKTVKDKPYIRQAWLEAGLVHDPVKLVRRTDAGEEIPVSIWRLEFSIRSDVKNWVKVRNETGKGSNKYFSLKNTLDIYADSTKRLELFSSLVHHYFHFKHYEEGKTKYRCEDKVLFDFGEHQCFYTVEKLASDKSPLSIVQKLKNLLEQFLFEDVKSEAKNAAKLLSQLLDTEILRSLASEYWSDREVRILQLLIRRRLDRPTESMEQARRWATIAAEQDATIFTQSEAVQ